MGEGLEYSMNLILWITPELFISYIPHYFLILCKKIILSKKLTLVIFSLITCIMHLITFMLVQAILLVVSNQFSLSSVVFSDSVLKNWAVDTKHSIGVIK